MTTGRSRQSRFKRFPAFIFGAVSVLASFGLVAEEPDFFRIGTGSTGGTYFPVGGLIANAVSNPPGSRPCEKGGSCGVPGLIAVAVSTTGSVANVEAVAQGQLESGLTQADVAYWAYSGTEIYKKKNRLEKLRAIANLYPESIHLVVRADSGIDSVKKLRGKRISLGEKKSGTLVDAKIVLKAFGLSSKRLKASYLKLSQAGDMMVEGELEGFFFVAGTPAAAIEDLARRVDIRLVPIAGPKIEAMLKTHPFFGTGEIPANTYQGVPSTPTLTVGAQWVVSTALNEDFVYKLTQALWNENTHRLLATGHPKGKQISIDTALTGVAIPLHPGAERYYREVEVIEETPIQKEEENDKEEKPVN